MDRHLPSRANHEPGRVGKTTVGFKPQASEDRLLPFVTYLGHNAKGAGRFALGARCTEARCGSDARVMTGLMKGWRAAEGAAGYVLIKGTV